MLRRNALFLLGGVALCFALTGCPPKPETTVTGVTIAPAQVVLDVGATAQLTARVHGTGSPSQNVAWLSEDEEVATIADAGLVTAIAEGQATITAMSTSDPRHSATVTVHVASDELTAFEERFDTPLMRAHAIELEEQGVTSHFLPAALMPGLDLQDSPRGSVFLGVMRIDVDPAQVDGMDEADEAASWMLGRFLAFEVLSSAIGPTIAGGSADPLSARSSEIGEASQYRLSDLFGNEFVIDAPALPSDVDFSHLAALPGAPTEDHPDVFPPRVPSESFDPPTPDSLWNPDAPKVIALIHGRTQPPAAPATLEQRINTKYHPLHYWGFDFVAELLGHPNATELWTFTESLADATPITRDEWDRRGFTMERLVDIWDAEKREFVGKLMMIHGLSLVAAGTCTVIAGGPIGAVIGSIMITIGGAEFVTGQFMKGQAQHQLETLTIPDVPVGHFAFYRGRHAPSAPPQYVAMLTFRDGSLPLEHHAQALAEQVHGLYGTLTNRVYSGEGPHLLLVTHSMGGLAARYMLSAPPGSAVDGEKAKDIADRTVVLVTLATLHEGSPGADWAVEVSESTLMRVLAALWGIRRLWQDSDLTLWGSTYRDPKTLWDVATGGGVPATSDVRMDAMRAMNLGPMAPHHAARRDGSLIPVYVLAGRTPSAGYFDDTSIRDDRRWAETLQYLLWDWRWPPNWFRETKPELGRLGNVLEEFARIVEERGRHPTIEPDPRDLSPLFRGERVAKEAGASMVADVALRLLEPDGWGAPVPAQGSVDRVHTTQAHPNLPYPSLYLRPQAGGEQDMDGLVPYASGMGVNLGTPIPDYFSHEHMWDVDGVEMRGSWCRFYSGPWEWEHHGSIHHYAPTGAWLHAQVVQHAGPLPAAYPCSVWLTAPPPSEDPPPVLPIAMDDDVSFYGSLGTPYGPAVVEIDVLANDVDPAGGSLRIVGVTQPALGRGIVTHSHELVSYQVGSGDDCQAAFEYTIENEEGGRASAVVSVYVGSLRADAPASEWLPDLSDVGILGRINEVGDAVATSCDVYMFCDVRLRKADGSFVDLGTLGGSSSAALGLNDDAVVVGWSNTAHGYRRPFVWDVVAGMRDLDAEPQWGDEGVAMAVNADGVVVGAVRRELFLSLGEGQGSVVALSPFSPEEVPLLGEAVVWRGGVVIDLHAALESKLGVVGEYGRSIATGVTDGDPMPVVVGTFYPAWPRGDEPVAFAWSDVNGNDRAELGEIVLLPSLGGGVSRATDVSERGLVVGVSENAAGVGRPVLWDLVGGARALLQLPGGVAVPRGINVHGQVVGDQGLSDGSRVPLYWAGNAMARADDVVGLPSGWVLESLNDINDRGDMVGVARTPGDRSRAVLLRAGN